MQSSGIPVKFAVPFGNSAVAPNIRPIPQASQIGVQNGAASLTDGFPPNCFIPIAAGGSWPFGQDFNGLLKQVTQWDQWQQAGGPVVYDATFSAAIGGYPKGATLYAAAGGFSWISTVENNVTNPDTGGGGWMKDGPYVNNGGFTGVGTNVISLGWSSATSGPLVGQIIAHVDSTTVGSLARLEGAAFTGSISAPTVTAGTGGISSTGSIFSSATVSGTNVSAGTGGFFTAANLQANGTGAIGGALTAGSVAATGVVSSLTGISTPGTVSATGTIVTANQLSSQNGVVTSGNIAAGVTTNPDPVGSGQAGIVLSVHGGIDSCSPAGNEWSSGNSVLHNFFTTSPVVFVGSITTNGSSTAYNTTSDYRLKVSIDPLTDACARIASVPVHRFAFIDSIPNDLAPSQIGTLPMVDGFLAHELAVGVPEAVTGTKDATATYTDVIVAASGKVITSGVSQADWAAGILAVVDVAPIPAVEARDAVEAVPATETTPVIPAQAAVVAVAGVPGVAGRAPIYPPDSTWQASLTVPVYQQVAQDKLTPVLWAAVQELTAAVTALQTQIAAMTAAKAA